MNKKPADKKQQLTWKQNQEQILKAIRKIESSDLARPYANISEIQKTTGISRPTIYKHLKFLTAKGLVFPAQARGKGTWLQSRYAQAARKAYEEMLKKDIDLQGFVANPQKADENASDFREKLTRALISDSGELDCYFKSELEWLKEICAEYFVNGKRKMFGANANPLWFARQYSKVLTDLEDELTEWQNITYNKEQYCDSKISVESVKEATADLFKVFCDLKALVYTANFLAINYQCVDDNLSFQFRDTAAETLDSCAIALKKINAVLSHAQS